MGWNLFGLPYLVSHYVTGTPEGDGLDCPMNFPHIVYGLDDTTGAYQTGQSWTAGHDMGWGKGYFTQTATLDDREIIRFAQPVFAESVQAEARQQVCVESLSGKDVLTVCPDREADATMDYHLGADAIKWMALNKDVPQIYTFNGNETRFALMASAPVETEIGLGVQAAEAGAYTVSLPDKEGYAEYHAVWLRDRKTGCCTNLLREDYSLMLDEQENCMDRLTLQFGGQRPGDGVAGGEDGAAYAVYVDEGFLHIDGLRGGESLRIYNAAGQLLEAATAHGVTYRTRVESGVYVVKVNRSIFKIKY